jgi:hypothetical protein
MNGGKSDGCQLLMAATKTPFTALQRSRFDCRTVTLSGDVKSSSVSVTVGLR